MLGLALEFLKGCASEKHEISTVRSKGVAVQGPNDQCGVAPSQSIIFTIFKLEPLTFLAIWHIFCKIEFFI